MVRGNRQNRRGVNRGHHSNVRPSDADASTAARRNVGIAEDGTEDLVAHKVYLAVDCQASFDTLEHCFEKSNSVYHYNVGTVPISMSLADKKMYPEVAEAFEAAKMEDANQMPYLELVFNAPQTEWADAPIVIARNAHLCRPIRMKLNKSYFLERMQDNHRFNISVNVTGSLYRTEFRRGRHIPLALDNGMIALNVEKDGSSVEAVSVMCPGVFGNFHLQGNFTVLLKWYGPDLTFDCLPLYKKLAEDIPADVSIVLEDGQAYQSHSSLLKGCSPVFTAMLESNMSEGQTKVIQMKDVDATVLETFLKFLTKGNFVNAFESCEICFQLFMFCHKYDIALLEKATRTLLEEKSLEWISTSTALEMVCFMRIHAGTEILYERAKSILQSRKEEVQELNGFKELLEKDPQLVEIIRN